MIQTKLFTKRPLALAMGSLLMSSIPFGLHAQETEVPIDETEVIEVKGFRGSLNRSLLTKRAAVNNVELLVSFLI